MGYCSTWKLALKGTQQQIQDFKQWLIDGAGVCEDPPDEEYKSCTSFLQRCLDAEVDGGVVYSHFDSKAAIVDAMYGEAWAELDAHSERLEADLPARGRDR